MATDRILIHTSIAEPFTTALQKALATTSPDPTTLPPTLVNTASKARIQTLLTNALASGAHFISGSTPADVDATLPSGCGVRMAPAILGGVSEDMPVWQEEAFASVAACMTFDSEEEAIRLANGSGYGLSASVFTEDLRRGFALARRIQSG
jgi:acyl-CoA reductase-like NAD-dependent aldehyde dehydrogenase